MRLISTLSLMGISLCASLSAMAQPASSAAKCSSFKRNTTARTTVASPAEDNYDVKYVKLDLKVSNTNTYVAGNVITTAQVVASSMSSYVFELDDVHTIDSVLIDGSSVTFTSSGAIRTATLPTSLSAGDMFTAQVFYRGTPASGSLFGGTKGINCFNSPSWGNRVLFTLSESYHAYEWWPCKQSLRDKIDSSDIWLTVPDSLKAGSNGLLQAITPMGGGFNRFEWKERYPIDYYLISLAVANYQDYSHYMHFTDVSGTDSMLMQHYIYNNPGTYSAFHARFDSTDLMVNYFSETFGRYPFWKEKYGHCMAPLGGGMEHQTMSTMGWFDGGLIAHELGHQWFGDNVTCGTWKDIFMNEGFASYCEYLYWDHFISHTSATNDMIARFDNVKSLPGGSVYCTDTTDEGRIFDSRLSYDKGACVLHMLRFVVNNDSTYFAIWKNYQDAKRDSTGIIPDFMNQTIAATGTAVDGMRIDTFFNQWMYGEGYPMYAITWNQIGTDVYVRLQQSTSVPTSVPFFFTPMELKLKSAAGDTIVKVFNNIPDQIFHFTWSKSMTGVVTDPNYWLLYAVNSNSKDVTLDITGGAAVASVLVTPNPTTNDWTITGINNGTKLILTDMTGRVLYNYSATEDHVTIPATQLSLGMYMLTVDNAGISRSFKLVKQ